MKVLVTGASGAIGGQLIHRLRVAGHRVVGAAHRSPVNVETEACVTIDLTEPGAPERLLGELRPEVVVHTAALANPADCERDPERAELLNVTLVRELAEAVRARGLRMIHFSTDLVFDGGRGPFREEDAPQPRSHYARTKQAGEAEALAAGNCVVLRSALSFGHSRTGDRTFNEWIVARIGAGEVPILFEDEYRTPIDDATLARAVERLLDHEFTGLLHAGGGERVSRLLFGRELLEVAGLPAESVRGGSRNDLDLTPPRPEDVSLDTSRLRDVTGVRLPSVREALSQWWHEYGGARA
ncbi:MAG: SDR family oxidoreductase [Planctomycetota bacterium]